MTKRKKANVAQSVERRHGKTEVCGSIPHIGSVLSDAHLHSMNDITILTQQFCDYSTFIKGYKLPTIKRYKYAIGFYQRFAQIETLSDVTCSNVRALFVYGRTERGWSANTFINYHKSLTVFFRWCIKNEYIDFDPLQDIELPKLEKRLPAKLTKQDALRLLEIVYNYPYDFQFLRYRNHAIFATFVFAGLRKQELLNLKLTDVDLENLTIFVNQGKGGKDRIVPMSYTLAQTLKRYAEERKRLKKTCPEFFTSLNRNCGFTDSGLKRLKKKMVETSKIKFSIHKLRHTFATLMLEGGCDIYSLSKMLGHSDIKTTTIYLAASAEHLRGQIGKHPLNELSVNGIK